ncbi:RluA family pseudouridine synthase, partial [endosymbiont of Ridgeia piscesae]
RIPPVRLAASPAPPRFSREQRERLERSILFEDERIMVINKPAGMAVHGGSGLSFGVIEALRALRPEERSLELVHRLDRDTSGCLLLSKRRSALRSLHELMQKNLVDKRYLALLAGSWRKGRQEVDAPLLKNTLKGGERVVIVDAAGKPSLTRFTRVRRFKQATLVEAELVTGRTHQIRVHSAWLGSPILGDTRYGDEIANRQLRQLGLKRLFLHAHSIKFRWPGEKRDQEFKAPLPDVLEAVLNELDK